jgi:hypothetical protein
MLTVALNGRLYSPGQAPKGKDCTAFGLEKDSALWLIVKGTGCGFCLFTLIMIRPTNKNRLVQKTCNQ